MLQCDGLTTCLLPRAIKLLYGQMKAYKPGSTPNRTITPTDYSFYDAFIVPYHDPTKFMGEAYENLCIPALEEAGVKEAKGLVEMTVSCVFFTFDTGMPINPLASSAIMLQRKPKIGNASARHRKAT
jgi:hypothetical protein